MSAKPQQQAAQESVARLYSGTRKQPQQKPGNRKLYEMQEEGNKKKKSQTATPDLAVEWQSCPRSPGHSSSASRALVAPSCTTEGEHCTMPLYFFSIIQCTHALGMSCHVLCSRSADQANTTANRTARLVKKTHQSHHGMSCVFTLPGYQLNMGHRLHMPTQR